MQDLKTDAAFATGQQSGDRLINNQTGNQNIYSFFAFPEGEKVPLVASFLSESGCRYVSDFAPNEKGGGDAQRR